MEASLNDLPFYLTADQLHLVASNLLAAILMSFWTASIRLCVGVTTAVVADHLSYSMSSKFCLCYH